VDTPTRLAQWLSRYAKSAELPDDQKLLRLANEVSKQVPESALDLVLRSLKNLEPLSPDQTTVLATLMFPYPSEPFEARNMGWSDDQGAVLLLNQIKKLDYFGRTYLSSDQDRAEGLRRLLLALIEDVRVALITLAWQLAKLQAARRLDDESRQAIAEETRLIYAPLANRLGIWQLKWALEDLAFQYLEPRAYQRIRRLVAEQHQDREVFIERFIQELQNKLEAEHLSAEVTGRAKHIYSIWRKMQRKGLDFHELFDVRAVRVLVSTVAQCYSALGLVHTHWRPVPGEFDDYITNPKANLYQSLHTAVIGPGGRVIEVQIRTHEMHQHAELGVAAHWRYKEGGPRDAQLEARIGMMRQLFDGGDVDDQSILEGFENLTNEDRVYVITPTGEVKDLVAGATPLDFAYLIHTEVGHRCRGARINGRIVPLTTELSNGDRVEILTGKESRPSRDWMLPKMGYIRSARARAKVRQWFKLAHYDENLAAGRHALDTELKRLALDSHDLVSVAKVFNLNKIEDVYVAVGCGDLTASQVARAIERQHHTAPLGFESAIRPVIPSSQSGDDIQIEGVGNLLHQIARCCQPLPGDQIGGYVTQGRGVSIHRADCRQFLHLHRAHPERILAVRWRNQRTERYSAKLVIEAWDRPGLIKDISTILSTENANVSALHGQPKGDGETVTIEIAIQVTDFDQLSTLLARLNGLESILSATRSR
jgi:GTP pyrophosphokinase